MRGLHALGVSTDSHGSLLTSIVMDKLPPGIRIVISRELTGETWSVGEVTSILSLRWDVSAQEYSVALSGSIPVHSPKRHDLPQRGKPLHLSATALMPSSQGGPYCVYCGQGHESPSCTAVKSAVARKELLRKTGKCYICLKKRHLSRDCRSTNSCGKFQGRHHMSHLFPQQLFAW